MKTEEVKRLKPKSNTLRELFLKSGNLCAFPNCENLMMNHEGVFIGQVCHIEAAEEGGERFNPKMTNEERRSFPNLFLMCYEHHTVTNDVKKYTVKKLQKLKKDHEKRFAMPDRAISEKLVDWTTRSEPTAATNLKKLVSVLELGLSDCECAEYVEELAEYVERFKLVPVDVRQFLGSVALRIDRMSATDTVSDGFNRVEILISDLKSAFGIGDHLLRTRLQQFEAYNLGGHEEMYTSLGDQPAISISYLSGGWPLWRDIVAFCKATDTPIETFTEEMDFSILDD